MSLAPNTGSLASEYRDPGLKPEDTWYYRVFALNSAGTGPVSQDYLVQTAAAVIPGPVRAVTATQTGRNSIMLRWQPPASDGGADITKYRIHVGDSAVDAVSAPNYPDGPPAREADAMISTVNGVIETDVDDGTAYAHLKLNAGIRYVYEVYAVNAVGSSLTPGSSAAATTLELGKPGQPTNLTAVQTTNSIILLYWYAPTNTGGDDIQGYRVEVRTDPSDDSSNSFGDWDVGPTYSTAKTVSADASYPVVADIDRVQFRVYSQIDADANTATSGDLDDVVESVRSSNEVTVTIRDDAARAPLIPGAPIFVDTTSPPDAVRDAFGAVDLKWEAPAIDSSDDTDDDNAPESIGGYRIDVSDDGISWEQLERQTRRTDTEYHYNDPDREDRHYRIFAWHAQTLGPAQTAVVVSEFTTGVPEAPGFVKSLKATPNGPTQIDLTWTKPDDEGNAPIVEYRIQTSMRNTDTPPAFADWPSDTAADTERNFTSKTTSWSHEELSSGQTWRYRVVAVNDDGETIDNMTFTGPVAGALVAQASTPQEMMPRAPEGVVAEAAKDSNLTGSQDRGVLLLWNAPTAPAGATIGGYRIERKVNNGVWEELEDNTDNRWTDFTDIDEPEMDETRAYRVRAISNNDVDGEWAMTYYPQMVITHNTAPTAVGTIAAQTVSAGQSVTVDVAANFSDADTGDTLTYTASSDMEMYATADIPAGSSMLTITGVAAGMATITVTATDAAGAYAMQTIMVTVEAVDTTPMAPTSVMATVDDSDPGSTSVTVTWTDGANVPAYGVVLFVDDFTPTIYIGRGTGGSHTFTEVASGSYIAVVVALDAQGGLMTDVQGNYLYAGATVVIVQ